MKPETAYMQRVQRELSDINVTLFRNNVGSVQVTDCRCPVKRVIRYGVCNPGGSDLIGWRPVIVAPEMVGKPAAIFTAVETKFGRGKLTDGQRNFLEHVRLAGGIAVESRDLNQTIAEVVFK